MSSMLTESVAKSEIKVAVERRNGHLLLTTRDLEHLNALVDTARARGGVLSELSPVRSSLEDVFVDLVRTGEEEDKVQ